MNAKYLSLLVLFIVSVKLCMAQTQLMDTMVNMNTSVDNLSLCPDKKEIYLYIDLNASSAAKRVPLNIAIVLDRSGSMEEEERMQNAKTALTYLIDHLNTEDVCSIIIYDHLADVLHGATPVSYKERENLKRKIHHITPGGHTNISMGLQLGYKEVKSTYSADKINRVLLLSDGIANEGITDDFLLEMIAREYSQREGISMSTFGMGHEFNEKLMHNLAEYGGGNYYFIEKSNEAINDFVSEVKLLEGIVAQNGTLKIKYPSANLAISHVFGFPYTNNNDEIVIDLKEVHPKEKHGVLVKFYINNMPKDSLVFSSSLQYVNVLNSKPVYKTQSIVVKKSNNPDDCQKGFNQEVFNKVVFFSSNYYLDSAVDHVEKGDIENAKSTLASAKKLHNQVISQQGKSDSLSQQSQLIDEYQTELEKNKAASPYQLKILNKRIRHKNYKLRKMTNKCPQQN